MNKTRCEKCGRFARKIDMGPYRIYKFSVHQKGFFCDSCGACVTRHISPELKDYMDYFEASVEALREKCEENAELQKEISFHKQTLKEMTEGICDLNAEISAHEANCERLTNGIAQLQKERENLQLVAENRDKKIRSLKRDNRIFIAVMILCSIEMIIRWCVK